MSLVLLLSNGMENIWIDKISGRGVKIMEIISDNGFRSISLDKKKTQIFAPTKLVYHTLCMFVKKNFKKIYNFSLLNNKITFYSDDLSIENDVEMWYA